MANTPKMNFGELPKENQGNIQPGEHEMVIVSAKKELSKKGKPMLVLQVAPKTAKNLKIYDRYTLFDENYQPESFGQYKLRNLLKAVDYIPKGEFTIESLAQFLPDLEFKATLEYEEGSNGKQYLTIADADSYAPIEANPAEEAEEENELPEADDEDQTPEPAPKKKPKKKPSAKVKAELEEDDDVV